MPESRGGGSSGGDGWPSPDRAGTGHAPSWRMEGAEEEEEEEEDSSGNSPDIPDVDLKEQKSRRSQTEEWSLSLSV